jgi:hypothetical protein
MGVKTVNLSVSASLNKVFTSQEELQSLFLTLIKLSRTMFECYRSFKLSQERKIFPISLSSFQILVFYNYDDAE